MSLCRLFWRRAASEGPLAVRGAGASNVQHSTFNVQRSTFNAGGNPPLAPPRRGTRTHGALRLGAPVSDRLCVSKLAKGLGRHVHVRACVSVKPTRRRRSGRGWSALRAAIGSADVLIRSAGNDTAIGERFRVVRSGGALRVRDHSRSGRLGTRTALRPQRMKGHYGVRRFGVTLARHNHPIYALTSCR
jgi:hypothetical protein